MSLDPLAHVRALLALAKAAPAPSFEPSTSTLTPAPIVLPPEDWRAEYRDVLDHGPWRAVHQIGKDGKLLEHTPMPPLDRITSVQVTLYEEPERPLTTSKRQREPTARDLPATHKVLIELWTVPLAEIQRHRVHTQWRHYTKLRTDKGAVGSLTNSMKKGQINKNFESYAHDIIFGRGPGSESDLFGVPYDTNGGWFYYDDHLVEVEMADEEAPVVRIHRNRELLVEITLNTRFAGRRMQSGSLVIASNRLNLVEDNG